jgi:hypothetical protein
MELARTLLATDNSGSFAIFGGVSLIGWAIGLALFIFSIFCLVDLMKYSDAQWAASGQEKNTALIVCIVSLVCCGFLSLYYWFGIRPKVQGVS